MLTEFIGWLSAALLAVTISRQVYTQWKTKSAAGVSKWLFIGQVGASTGFTVYSWMVDNWVFVFTNFYILLTAIVGEGVYWRNKKLDERKRGQVQPGAEVVRR